MAMSSCVVRRAASCSSSLIALATRYARAPLANRSPGSSSFPPLLHLRLLPFSTDSPESPEFPNSKQTASGTSDKVSLLDGLAFDSIKEYPKSGVIFLRRTTEDEIIKILVQTSSKYDDDDIEKAGCFSFGDDGSSVYDDFDCYDVNDSDDEITHEEEGDEEDSELSEEEVDGVPHLKLLVKIQYGENFDRCFEFSGSASPNHDLMSLDAISFRKARKRGEPVGLNHLDELEDFFKKRGIEPGNFNFLFNYIEKLSQIHNHSASIGKKVLAHPW